LKSDLDALMEKHGLDALLVIGAATHNPMMHYFTGDVHMGDGALIKPRGAAPTLFYNPMERDEAARTGHATRNLVDYDLPALTKKHNGDAVQAQAERYAKMLADCGVAKGRVGLFGKVEIGAPFAIFNALAQMAPQYEVVGQSGRTLLAEAMETKEPDEVERIRRMGRITAEVVGRVKAYLQSHTAVDGRLVNGDGAPVTVGDVKTFINSAALELGVENPHGTIFAIGRDAGVPHSTGNPEDALELGKTIVFDIFLQEPGGGYHFDFTRTWCLGYAPPEAQKLYDEVKQVFDDLMGGLEANAPFKALQERACDLFEAQGHATIRQDPAIQEGYVHSVGHGIGLNIHEQPFSREESLLRPGVVVTIEPGLYYPGRGMGVRIEDSVYVRPDGGIEVLADFPHDLVVPIDGA
jgi:Xaa-Pro aminopeptidase